MVPVEVLGRLGGVAARGALARHCSRVALDRAVAGGDIVIDARGRYALPGADAGLRAANRLTGVSSHRSAAQHWGWAQKYPPKTPEITLPKGRKLTPTQRRGVVIHRAGLAPEDVDGLVTSRRRTLVDCLRCLPEDEALAIADSALREGDETPESLRSLVAGLRGPGRLQAVWVAEHASALAANAFESALRWLATRAGLAVRPQVRVYGPHFLGRPDLVDGERGIILEADSFAWHGKRSALRRDSRRYNAFVVAGWLVLRFSWEDVMFDPDYVIDVLSSFAQERTYCRRCGRVPA